MFYKHVVIPTRLFGGSSEGVGEGETVEVTEEVGSGDEDGETVGFFVTTEERKPLVHLRTGVGGRVDAFDAEDFEDMIGSPTILLTGDPFEVFVGIVGDVTIFVVCFERDSVFTDWSGSLEGE